MKGLDLVEGSDEFKIGLEPDHVRVMNASDGKAWANLGGDYLTKGSDQEEAGEPK